MEELPLTLCRVRELSHWVGIALGLAKVSVACEDSDGAFLACIEPLNVYAIVEARAIVVLILLLPWSFVFHGPCRLLECASTIVPRHALLLELRCWPTILHLARA